MTTTKDLGGVELSLSSAGDLVFSANGKGIAIVKRDLLTPESRNALTAFYKSTSELHNIDEWEPGEVVVAARPCLVRDLHGLPFTVMRGQRIDERSIIEQILTIKEPEPVRLLRFGAELEVESLLREALTVKGQEGMAQSVLMQKRTIMAMQG